MTNYWMETRARSPALHAPADRHTVAQSMNPDWVLRRFPNQRPATESRVITTWYCPINKPPGGSLMLDKDSLDSPAFPQTSGSRRVELHSRSASVISRASPKLHHLLISVSSSLSCGKSPPPLPPPQGHRDGLTDAPLSPARPRHLRSPHLTQLRGRRPCVLWRPAARPSLRAVIQMLLLNSARERDRERERDRQTDRQTDWEGEEERGEERRGGTNHNVWACVTSAEHQYYTPLIIVSLYVICQPGCARVSVCVRESVRERGNTTLINIPYIPIVIINVYGLW